MIAAIFPICIVVAWIFISYIVSIMGKRRRETAALGRSPNHQRSLFSSEERASSFPRITAIGTWNHDNCGFKFRNAKNNTTPDGVENTNFRKVQSNMDIRTALQSRSRIPDQRNERGLFGFRIRNTRNIRAPTIAKNANTQQVQSQISRIAVRSKRGIPEKYDFRKDSSFLASRTRNSRKIRAPATAKNTNTQHVRNNISSKAVRPQRGILERYDLRKENDFVHSRWGNVGNSTTISVAEKANAQQEGSKISSVMDQPLSPTVVDSGLGIEDGIRLSRVRHQRNDLPSIAEDLRPQRISRIRSSTEDRSPSKFPVRRGHPKKHALLASRLKFSRKDTAWANVQNANIRQTLGRIGQVEGRPLSEMTAAYELGFHGSSMENIRNSGLTAMVQDLNSTDIPRIGDRTEFLPLSERVGGYESSPETGTYFSGLRNENEDISFFIPLDSNARYMQRISSSVEVINQWAILGVFESFLEFVLRFFGLRNGKGINFNPFAQNIGSIRDSRGDQPLNETMEGYECPICLDTRDWKEMTYLPCLHKFHKKCIDKWMKENEMCPICRMSIK